MVLAGETDEAASQLAKGHRTDDGKGTGPEKFDADEFTEGQRVELLNQLPNDFTRFATSK